MIQRNQKLEKQVKSMSLATIETSDRRETLMKLVKHGYCENGETSDISVELENLTIFS